MKKMFPLFAAASLFLGACGSGSMDLARELNSTYKHDGETIELEGKLSTNLMVWGSTERSTLDLCMTCGSALDNTKSERVSDIIVHYGTSPNSVVINVPPDAREFKDTDVNLYDKNGTKLALSDKVKIKGKIIYTAKGPKKQGPTPKIKVPQINKEGPQGDGNDYSYKITDVSIEKI